MARLTGRTVAFLTSSKGIEEPELTTPWKAVADEGGTPVLVSAEAGTVRAVNNDLDPGGEYPVDRTLDQVSADDIDALVIPGGTVNADTLRTQEGAQALVKAVLGAGKPVAAICHGPWTLIEAGVVDGVTLTSYPSLATDLRNAGATWVDEEVVVSQAAGATLITSRNPDDLPAFSAAVVDAVAG
ncbi:type 1 glutamine amidotransferase domain-containing protein [Cellulomonas sp. PS-H5]|uniref:type 1 glutamine amidotransferase domain-containing protein n=1 Tax=Cellulomonas sp. PS-H5 TaxID=2820400 RepID=UPI001C4E833C|nr:type 1 glutamine amidotransferase domain-containing protein [Cellulomonas sp. PS-H5]MBW0255380.1 type 1 glutamine amidotransferase [Cellulomonas sp. PS-H5]